MFKSFYSFNDKYLAKQYSFEFEKLLYNYFPFYNKIFVNLYTIDEQNSIAKSLTVSETPSYFSRLATTERPYDRQQTGLQYKLIKDFPLYFILNAEETTFRFSDNIFGYLQNFTAVAKNYPEVNTFIGSVVQLQSRFGEEPRLFRVNNETKFSAFSYNHEITIYKLELSVLNAEFDPKISSTYTYSELYDRLVTEEQDLKTREYLTAYNTLLNKLKTNLNSNKWTIGIHYDSTLQDYVVIFDVLLLYNAFFNSHVLQNLKLLNFVSPYPNADVFNSSILQTNTVISFTAYYAVVKNNTIIDYYPQEIVSITLTDYRSHNFDLSVSITNNITETINFWYQLFAAYYNLTNPVF